MDGPAFSRPLLTGHPVIRSAFLACLHVHRADHALHARALALRTVGFSPFVVLQGLDDGEVMLTVLAAVLINWHLAPSGLPPI